MVWRNNPINEIMNYELRMMNDELWEGELWGGNEVVRDVNFWMKREDFWKIVIARSPYGRRGNLGKVRCSEVLCVVFVVCYRRLLSKISVKYIPNCIFTIWYVQVVKIKGKNVCKYIPNKYLAKWYVFLVWTKAVVIQKYIPNCIFTIWYV